MTKHPISLEEVTLHTRKAFDVLTSILDEYAEPTHFKDDGTPVRPQASVVVGAAKTILDTARQSLEAHITEKDGLVTARAVQSLSNDELEARVLEIKRNNPESSAA